MFMGICSKDLPGCELTEATWSSDQISSTRTRTKGKPSSCPAFFVGLGDFLRKNFRGVVRDLC